MREERITLDGVPALLLGEPSGQGYLYVHGQHGRKEEAAPFARAAQARGFQVLSIDLPGHGGRDGELTPWDALPELARAMAEARARWRRVRLHATSIGAWLSLLAFAQDAPEISLFVSPVVDMETLIRQMMRASGVTHERLAREGVIQTPSGTLSFAYLSYVRAHPVARWASQTAILYAGGDALVARDTVEAFARRFSCELTVLPGMEHWFHTPGQLDALRAWERAQLAQGEGVCESSE